MNQNKYLYSVGLLALVFITSGCFKHLYGYKNKIENMQVPRLMIESRSMNYAGSGGMQLTLPISGSTIFVDSTPIVSEYDIMNVEMVKVDDLGRIDYDHLESLLSNTGQKTLVSIMHANNEIGTLSDMDRISDLCSTYGAYYHSWHA